MKEVTADESVRQRLSSMAGFMRTPDRNTYAMIRSPGYRAGLMLIACGWAQELAKFGWSKEKVKDFLWENSKLPWSEAEKTGLTERILSIGLPKGEPAPHTNNPEDIQLVVAGGEQSMHSYWMQVGTPNTVSSKGIILPVKEKWENLLEQAEKDLGPLPAR